MIALGGSDDLFHAPHGNASMDYEVLKYVRENWDYETRQQEFSRKLAHIWVQRHRKGWNPTSRILACLVYEPGDYWQAVLAVLDSEKQA